MENDIQLIELLFQINRRIWKLLSPIFRKEQLSITELLVLTIMSKKKTSRVIQLATVIGVPPSTVTGILDRLVREGFLQRGRDPSDRRSVSITATAKLGSFIRKTAAPIEEMLRAGLGPMAASRKKRLTADLRFLLESLEQESDGANTAHQFKESALRGR